MCSSISSRTRARTPWSVRFDQMRLAGGQHDAVDLLDPRRRTAQAHQVALGADRGGVPQDDLGAAHRRAVAAQQADLGFVRVGVEIAVIVARHGFGDGMLVGHDELRARRPRLVGFACDREQGGQRRPQRLGAVFDRARGGDRALAASGARDRTGARAGARGTTAARGAAGRRQLVDATHTGDLRQAELLGGLRTHLGSVAVDRLPAAEHEVARAELLDRSGERIARGQRVGAGKGAVGQQHDFVGAAVQRFAQHLGRGRRAHREDGHPAAVALLETQRFLEGVQVFGIEDRPAGRRG